MSKPGIVIWDFDGVICDSLYECITVTVAAAYSIDNPHETINKDNLYKICSAENVLPIYERLQYLRPFVVNGQDYLWQYYYLDEFNSDILSSEQYNNIFEEISNKSTDKSYEIAFYATRKRIANIMGLQYFNLFKLYDGAIYAFRAAQHWHENYICTARDQQAVKLLFGNNGIEFPEGKIYSRDFNGLVKNPVLTKSQQIMSILENRGGLDQPFTLIEDQIKAPVELLEHCPNMRVLHAVYGYGLNVDWIQAQLPNIEAIINSDELIYALY